jgi:hypothetical protein
MCHTPNMARPAPRGDLGRTAVVGMGDDTRHQRHRQPPWAGACVRVSHFLQRGGDRVCHTTTPAYGRD